MFGALLKICGASLLLVICRLKKKNTVLKQQKISVAYLRFIVGFVTVTEFNYYTTYFHVCILISTLSTARAYFPLSHWWDRASFKNICNMYICWVIYGSWKNAYAHVSGMRNRVCVCLWIMHDSTLSTIVLLPKVSHFANKVTVSRLMWVLCVCRFLKFQRIPKMRGHS